MTNPTEADDFATLAQLADDAEEGDTLRVSLTGGYVNTTDRVVEGEVVSTDYTEGYGKRSVDVTIRGRYVSDDDPDDTLYFFVSATDRSADAITVGAAKTNKRRDYASQHTKKGDPTDTVVSVVDDSDD